MSPPYPRVSYLVFTRSQGAQEAISGPWSPSDVSRVYTALMESSAFKTVYLAPGVTILRLNHHPGHLAPVGAHPAPHVHQHRTVLHRHKARPSAAQARRRALRARYYRRHHPPTIGGRPRVP
jgi:hypothetical protein